MKPSFLPPNYSEIIRKHLRSAILSRSDKEEDYMLRTIFEGWKTLNEDVKIFIRNELNEHAFGRHAGANLVRLTEWERLRKLVG